MNRRLDSPAQLRDLLGVPLTDEQLSAIAAPLTPGVIVAGAGSGKTTVMAARVVWLVGTGQVQPDQVLGLTFTNKAAGELALRVRHALTSYGVYPAGRRGAANTDGAGGGGPDGWDGSDGDDDERGEPTVLTYHAYAARLLREHGLRIGVEPDAWLLADATRYQLAARVIRRARGPFRELTSPISYLVGDLLALDAELAEHLVEPERLREFDEALLAELAGLPANGKAVAEAAAAARKRLEFTRLVGAYRDEKRARAVTDFGEQMHDAARLAEARPEVGQGERDRFRVVLLDEYQDTSVAQRRMLVGLFGGGHPVTAVGDPCQAIYGWRGASVANLDEFGTHFPGAGGEPVRGYPLAENRRSGGRILAAANDLAASLRAVHSGVTALRPAAGAEQAGTIRVALHETYADEIDWLADQVAAILTDGTAPGQVAILARVSSDFAPIHAALTARGIPVEVVGLGGLLRLPEISDVLAVLEVLDDPTSNSALLRLLSGPRWRIGPRDLALLGRRATQLVRIPGIERDAEDPDAVLDEAVGGIDPSEIVALCDALESPGDGPYSAAARARFALLAAEIRQLRRHLGEPLLDLVHRVVGTTGLDVELAASPHAVATRRRDSLSAFLDVAAQFRDLEDDPSVAAFLAYLRAAAEHERGLDQATPGGSESVKLLTVHAAKGLEWDVVVLPNVSAGVFPSRRGRSKWTSSGKVLPSPLRGDRAWMPVLANWSPAAVREFAAACKQHEALEERRLGYVAVTRPRRLLVASGHWWGPSQRKPRGPSDFLSELAAGCETGLGEVVRWCEAPADGATNPQLETRAELAWPVPLDPVGYAHRQEAAGWVRDAIDATAERLGQTAGGSGLDVPAVPAVAGSAARDTAALGPADRERVAGWDRDLELLLAELKESRAAERTVVLPLSLSATQLMWLAADEDGFARELARPLPRPPAIAARRGVRFHAWVESRFGQQPLIVDDELPGAADADIEDDADLEGLRAAFERGEWARRIPHAIEVPFHLVLGGRSVRGRIDAVYADPDGGFTVIDWKTNRTQSADPLQLAVYRLAWAELHALPLSAVRAAFVYIRTGQTVVPEPLADREQLEALLAP
ncbi:MAG TPA: ATP-dependent DNA helicase [Actinomycetes bacterium]|nr:ATP-dependent DNA helicase [Actinomycetes bacterium]